jgi:hypothetical protein
MKPDVETRSTYRRLQRVFAGFAFDYAGRVRGVFTSICGGPCAWSRLRPMDRRRLNIIELDQLDSAVIVQNRSPAMEEACRLPTDTYWWLSLPVVALVFLQ